MPKPNPRSKGLFPHRAKTKKVMIYNEQIEVPNPPPVTFNGTPNPFVGCNYVPKVKGILLVSKYMIKRYGWDDAVARAVDRVRKGKGPGRPAYYVLQPNQY